ncbi:MAG: hypothetical protein RIS34_1164 [Pseudomonadota bacterium]|jgi:hypothetical protein
MKRRPFLLASAGLCLPVTTAWADSKWGEAAGYPSGWGNPPRFVGHTEYRVGNYSGGFESMFPVHKIGVSAQASPLASGLRDDISYRWGLSTRSIPDYLASWPVTGLLIARKGTLLAEHYRFGRKPGMRLTSWSMAKSVTSLLLGICIDKGLINSLDDRADAYVGDLKGTLHGSMTLRNLANMSSGAAILHDRDNPVIYPKAFTGGVTDLEAVVRGWNLSQESPGSRYNYNELCPLTVGMVIRQVTGTSLATFCQDALWQPMGAESEATWLTDSKGKEFNCIGFAARLRDWARLGQLVAQNGAMNGQQIVSERWIDECSSWTAQDAQVRYGRGMPAMGYKAFFWHPRADGSWMMMNGHHGQRVLVDRKTQTVLVHTAVDGEGNFQAELLELFGAATRLV